MSESKKHLTFAILEFLQKSCKDGTIKNEDVEGIEVAMQCIGEAFGVNLDDTEDQKKYSTKPANLLTIFDVYLNTKKRQTGGSASTASSSTPQSSDSKKELSAEDIQKAEDLKAAGNTKVAQKNYPEAIKLYTEAILINDNNAVYYANRAAAYTQQGDFQKAVEDALKSTEIDPSYSKAYSRLGHAYFSLSQYDNAISAYEKGLKIDPTNANMKSSLATAQAKAAENANQEESTNPQAGGLPGGLGGMDFASMLNNPAIMQMAQQMAQSGALDSLMSNPNIQEMAQKFSRGGTMPDMNTIQDMMKDPEMASLANQFLGSGSHTGSGSNGGNAA